MADAVETVGVRAVVEGAATYLANARSVNNATDAIGQQAKRTARDSEALSQALNRIGSRMQETGRQAIYLGGALAAPGIAAVGFATKFSQSMLQVSTLSGVAAGAIGDMREGVMAISRETARGPQELAEGLLIVTSTGIRGAQALDILRASAKASAVGLGDTATIARAVTAAVTAFRSQNLSAAAAADILFATVREGGAEVDEVAGTLGRVVGIAAQVGVSFADVGAFIATFTRLGVSADESVTALRGTLTLMLGTSQESVKTLEKLGLTFSELRRIAAEQGLPAALAKIIEATRGDDEALANLIPNVRALAGVLGTAGAQGEEFAGVADAVKNSMGDLGRVFDQNAEGPAFKMQQAIAALQRDLIAFGQAVLPAVAAVTGPVADLFEAFSRLPQPIQAVMATISLLGGGLLVLGGSLGVVLGGLLKVAPAFLALRTALAVTTAFIAANPIALAALAAALVVAGGAYLLLKGRMEEATKAQQASTQATQADTLAKQFNAREIDEAITGLNQHIAALTAERDAFANTNNLTAVGRVRLRELNEELTASKAKLEAYGQAHLVAGIAENNSVAAINSMIRSTEEQIAANKRSIAVLEEDIKEKRKNVGVTKETWEELDRLKNQNTALASGLTRLQSALGIASDKAKALGKASGEDAADGVKKLGDFAALTAKDISNLTAEAAAAMVVFDELGHLRQFKPVLTPQQLAAGAEGYQPGDEQDERGVLIGKAVDALKESERIKAEVKQTAETIAKGAGIETSDMKKAREDLEKAFESLNFETYGPKAVEAARKAGFNPEVFLRLIAQESGFSPTNASGGTLVSPSGARGIAQFMPGTAAALGINPDDPNQSLEGAAKLLKTYFDQFGNYVDALIAYNAGPGTVASYHRTGMLPDETAKYISAILGGGSGGAGGGLPILTQEQDKAAEEAKRRLEQQQEDEKRLREKLLQDALNAQERIHGDQIKELDQFGSLVEQALRRQAQQQYDIVVAGLHDQADAAKKTSEEFVRVAEDARDQAIKGVEAQRDASIKAAEDARDARIAAIEAEATARRNALQAQIDAIKGEQDAEDRITLERNIALAFDPEERQRAEAALREFDRRQQIDVLQQQITASDQAARDQIDQVRAASEERIQILKDESEAQLEQIRVRSDARVAANKADLEALQASLDAQEKAAKATYDTNTDDWNVSSKARMLIAQGELGTLAKLLDQYVPAWRTAGQSYGEQLINGIRNSGVESYIRNLLALAASLTGGSIGGLAGAQGAASAASARSQEIAGRQSQGSAAAAGGAPQSVLDSLRQQLVDMGVVPQFKGGLDVGVVSRPILAALDPGEVVLNPEQQRGYGGVRFERGAFEGMFNGTSFMGTPEENASAIEAMFDGFMNKELGREAWLHGA